jgi:hypothetical protein
MILRSETQSNDGGEFNHPVNLITFRALSKPVRSYDQHAPTNTPPYLPCVSRYPVGRDDTGRLLSDLRQTVAR